MQRRSSIDANVLIDEEDFGHRNERGDWTPVEALAYPPVFVWPPNARGFLKWLFSYVLSWNLFYAALALVGWIFLAPSMATAQSFGLGWMLGLLVRNLALVVLFYGAWHLRLYIRRDQATMFKFNERWPKTDSKSFLFRNQTRDNVFWSLLSGVPAWTAFEVLMLWAWANGYVGSLSWADDKVLIVLLMLAIPLFREVHFYVAHRLLHVPGLYKSVHKLHHNYTNPGPWSGLAMHPVEHVLYFSGVLVHFVVSAHPVLIMFQLVHAGLSPAPGHSGYAKVVIPGSKVRTVDTNGYAHYLHHKYFECNYADGAIPLDKWFGSFHDGTPAGHEAMKARLKQRRSAERTRT